MNTEIKPCACGGVVSCMIRWKDTPYRFCEKCYKEFMEEMPPMVEKWSKYESK